MAARQLAKLSLLENILHYFPPTSLSFAYGSGVFSQVGHDAGKKNMVDFILVVEDPLSWHKQNLRQNRSHYSFLKYGGSRLITQIQKEYGARVYFNTLVPIEDQIIKYGVISTEQFIADLLDWDTLYVSGRLHKPVKFVRKSENMDLSHALIINLQSALHTALLTLPERFTEEALFLRIASLSYIGDFRMMVGEDKQKVSNIVKAQMDGFVSLYESVLKSMPLLHWNEAEGVLEQDCSITTCLHHLNLLPRKVQQNLLLIWTKDGRHSDIEDILQAIAHDSNYGDLVMQAIQDIVCRNSWSQSIKGIFTAGIIKSLRYSGKKIKKMMLSIRKR